MNLGPCILNIIETLNLATTASSHIHAIQHSFTFLLPFSIKYLEVLEVSTNKL